MVISSIAVLYRITPICLKPGPSAGKIYRAIQISNLNRLLPKPGEKL